MSHKRITDQGLEVDLKYMPPTALEPEAIFLQFADPHLGTSHSWERWTFLSRENFLRLAKQFREAEERMKIGISDEAVRAMKERDERKEKSFYDRRVA